MPPCQKEVMENGIEKNPNSLGIIGFFQKSSVFEKTRGP
jgi:hypothetical protein